MAPVLVRIAESHIGSGCSSFVIAEAGVNHNGSVELAHRMIDVAADARVDAIKFQTFDPEVLVSPNAPKAAYQAENTHADGSQLEMLRELVLPNKSYPGLMQHAKDRGLIFLSTPFDFGSADVLERLGVPAFKISSGDLTNHPLLAHLARKNRPMLVSTGMASLAQVEAAMEVIEGAGGPPVVLYHCVTNYPTAPEECNLRAMATMRACFQVPVGWSDHTEGTDITIAAVALGAHSIEKHFTLDRNMPGPDHRASLEPAELVLMMRSIRRVESSLGSGVKRATASENRNSGAAKRSLHWSTDIPAGSVVSAKDLISLRPGTGISPQEQGRLIGLRLAVDVRHGQLVRHSDFEPVSK